MIRIRSLDHRAKRYSARKSWRYGSLLLGSILVFLGVAVLFRLKYDHREMEAARDALRADAPIAAESPAVSEAFERGGIDDLPAPARLFLARALPKRGPLARTARLAFSGTEREEPGSPVRPFQLDEILAPPGAIYLGMTYDGGGRQWELLREGVGVRHLRNRWHLPIGDEESHLVQRDLLGRLLSDALWFPEMLLPSRGAIWEAIDGRHARVRLPGTCYGCSAVLEVGSDGTPSSWDVERWHGAEKLHWIADQFQYEEGREFAGHHLPAGCRVRWFREEFDDFEHLQLRLEDAAY